MEALLGFGINLCNVCEKVKNTAGVAPFVIIPGDEFDEVFIEGDTGLGIKDRGMAITVQVRGDDFILGIGKYT